MELKSCITIIPKGFFHVEIVCHTPLYKINGLIVHYPLLHFFSFSLTTTSTDNKKLALVCSHQKDLSYAIAISCHFQQ